MTLSKAVRKEYYTEAEAAHALGISIARLHELLDQNIFNEGRIRPPDLEFNGSDLLLLAYWNREPRPGAAARAGKQNLVIMAKRK
jgi:hypothetical protein